MPWLRLDDGFAEHPKIAGLSAAAFRLHVEALCYCARNLTDGYVSQAVLKRFSGGRRAPKYAAELVDAGLWEPADERADGAQLARTCATDEPQSGAHLREAGWYIHDFLDFNPSREAVTDEREKARKRKEKSRSSRRDKTVTESHVTPESRRDTSDGHAVRHSAPPRPDPKPSSSPPTDTSVTPLRPAASGGEEDLNDGGQPPPAHDTPEWAEWWLPGPHTLDRTWTHMARWDLERHRAAGNVVRSPKGWLATAAANRRDQHLDMAEQLLAQRNHGNDYPLHVELAEQLDPTCGPRDGGTARAHNRRTNGAA